MALVRDPRREVRGSVHALGAMLATMRSRVGMLADVTRHALSMPDRAARALVLRDVDHWLRLQFLGVASRTGIAPALVEPATIEAVAARADVTDLELLEAFLQVGVALGELRFGRGRYRIKGRRLRAVALGPTDLRGRVEELVAVDSPVYAQLSDHLRGAPVRGYLDGAGDVIARASQLVEPLVAPVVRSAAAAIEPRRVLDIGCGSGVYLRHVLEVVPGASALGIDLDGDATSVARDTLAAWRSTGRCEVRTTDLDQLVDGDDGPFDLVLLLNDIYYWPPEARSDVLARVRTLAPRGTVLVSTTTASRQVFSRHLDLVLRVTRGTWRLPTGGELSEALRRAGFTHIELIAPVPRAGIVVAIAS